MKKIKIVLEYVGLNFAWQDQGYTYPNGDRVTCCWEDFDFEVFVDGKSWFGEPLSTTVDSRKFVEAEIEQLHGDLGEKMEIDFPGYIEEELSSTTFGIPYRDLPVSNSIHFGYSYDEPDDPDKYETEYFKNMPLNEFGMKPCYTFGYVPYDYISKDNVEDFFRAFADKHFGFDEEVEIEFEWKGEPTKEELDKQWKQHLEEIEEHEKMRREGRKYKVCFAIPFLKQMFGEETIAPYEEKGLLHGEQVEGTSGEILLHFKDGSTELLKDKDEFESDHFSEPTIGE